MHGIKKVSCEQNELSALRTGQRLSRMSRTFTPPDWSHHGSQPKQANNHQEKDERDEQEKCSPHVGKHTDSPPSLPSPGSTPNRFATTSRTRPLETRPHPSHVPNLAPRSIPTYCHRTIPGISRSCKRCLSKIGASLTPFCAFVEELLINLLHQP